MENIESIDMKLNSLYTTNEDFRSFVDKCAKTYKKTVNEVLKLQATYEYALYLKGEGRE